MGGMVCENFNLFVGVGEVDDRPSDDAIFEHWGVPVTPTYAEWVDY